MAEVLVFLFLENVTSVMSNRAQIPPALARHSERFLKLLTCSTNTTQAPAKISLNRGESDHRCYQRIGNKALRLEAEESVPGAVMKPPRCIRDDANSRASLHDDEKKCNAS